MPESGQEITETEALQTQANQAHGRTMQEQFVPRLVETGVVDENAKTFSIGREVNLGSDRRCEIRIEKDPFLSPRHARIYRNESERWMIEDQKSLNGVWIRVKKLAIDRRTEFQLGQQRFRFQPTLTWQTTDSPEVVMPDNSWTIGSDSSCDLVVKNNKVSGRHCRITVDGDRVVLTDLDSTNGTYINDERLEGTRVITTADTITLGQSQPMPWPRELESTAEKTAPAAVITIGRGPDNSVVLRDSNDSTHHARLLLEGQKIVLEDLGSTKGTSIGRVENKITRGVVQRGDRIFLGSKSYRVADLIDQSQPTPSIPKTDSAKSQARKRSHKLPLATASLGLAGFALIGLIWFATVRPTVEMTGTAPSPNEAAKTGPSAESKAMPAKENPATVSP